MGRRSLRPLLLNLRHLLYQESASEQTPRAHVRIAFLKCRLDRHLHRTTPLVQVGFLMARKERRLHTVTFAIFYPSSPPNTQPGQVEV